MLRKIALSSTPKPAPEPQAFRATWPLRESLVELKIDILRRKVVEGMFKGDAGAAFNYLTRELQCNLLFKNLTRQETKEAVRRLGVECAITAFNTEHSNAMKIWIILRATEMGYFSPEEGATIISKSSPTMALSLLINDALRNPGDLAKSERAKEFGMELIKNHDEQSAELYNMLYNLFKDRTGCFGKCDAANIQFKLGEYLLQKAADIDASLQTDRPVELAQDNMHLCYINAAKAFKTVADICRSLSAHSAEMGAAKKGLNAVNQAIKPLQEWLKEKGSLPPSHEQSLAKLELMRESLLDSYNYCLKQIERETANK